MTSNSDANHPDSRLDASTESSNFSPSTRPRYESNALLTLPTPLAVGRSTPSASSSGAVSRSSEDAYASDNGNQRLLASPPAESYPDEYRYAPGVPIDAQAPRSGTGTPVLRNPVAPSPYPGETQNPFRTPVPIVPQAAGYEEPFPLETGEDPLSPNRIRGVSLADNGPVPGPDGVRRVSRARRNSSQQAPQNRYSRGSMYGNLPPGAAPPQTGYPGGS
jgi:chitin synthase